jgi:Ran-binding protein 1
MAGITDIHTNPTSTTVPGEVNPTAEATEAVAENTVAEGTGQPADEKSATETATDAAFGAATKATDSVFSMFGGGPKKEKKEEPEAVDEPSGSSKAQKGGDDEVR